jgi:hypothetical protein
VILLNGTGLIKSFQLRLQRRELKYLFSDELSSWHYYGHHWWSEKFTINLGSCNFNKFCAYLHLIPAYDSHTCIARFMHKSKNETKRKRAMISYHILSTILEALYVLWTVRIAFRSYSACFPSLERHGENESVTAVFCEVKDYNCAPWPSLAKWRSPGEIQQLPEQPPPELARKQTPAATRLPVLEPGYRVPARQRPGPPFGHLPCSGTV